MRIGILTLHSQLNYGGVLQAFALQKFLRLQGHEACVIDRWMDPDNVMLRSHLASHSLTMRLKYLVRLLICPGVLKRWMRGRRTQDFISKNIRLSKSHFFGWSELPGGQLDLDCIVVGSDQVWNGTTPSTVPPFLLKGADKSIPAISYAPSFGMDELTDELRMLFKEGFSRFNALSVRESSGVKLIESLGFSAEKVLDPTLILPVKEWVRLSKNAEKGKRGLVCYLMSCDVGVALPLLDAWSKEHSQLVEVFVDHFEIGPIFRWANLKLTQKITSILRNGRVTLRLSAGPQTFLESFSVARWVLTDSFHALAFSCIFDKEVQVIRPVETWRARMFARILEFSRYVKGSYVCNSLEDGLQRLGQTRTQSFDKAVLKKDVQRSQTWLLNALGGQENKGWRYERTGGD